MAKVINFVAEETDLSTENGYQFEFNCDLCKKGYKSRFDAFNYGVMSSAAEGLGNYFGGIVDQITEMGSRLKDSAWEKEHDKAYERAVNKIKKDFSECPECGLWVCRKNCWNEKAKLCSSCSGIKQAEGEIKGEVVNCPECGAEILADDKFCSECGAKMEWKQFCTNCGSELEAGDKFCSKCGQSTN